MTAARMVSPSVLTKAVSMCSNMGLNEWAQEYVDRLSPTEVRVSEDWHLIRLPNSPDNIRAIGDPGNRYYFRVWMDGPEVMCAEVVDRIDPDGSFYLALRGPEGVVIPDSRWSDPEVESRRHEATLKAR